MATEPRCQDEYSFSFFMSSVFARNKIMFLFIFTLVYKTWAYIICTYEYIWCSMKTLSEILIADESVPFWMAAVVHISASSKSTWYNNENNKQNIVIGGVRCKLFRWKILTTQEAKEKIHNVLNKPKSKAQCTWHLCVEQQRYDS